MLSQELTWVGGVDDFALTIELMRGLQAKCEAGPFEIYARLGGGSWRIDDVIETLRLGLEGGGMDKQEARELVLRHAEPVAPLVLTARAVVAAFLFGVDEDDPAGEASAEAGTKTVAPASAMENGASPISTEPAQR